MEMESPWEPLWRAPFVGAAATFAFLVILVMVYRPVLMGLTVALL
ncbi:hypothetical protein WJS89_11320 [Sphingomicrobium sp. XHP0235]